MTSEQRDVTIGALAVAALIALTALVFTLTSCVTVTSPCLEWAPALDTVRLANGHLDTTGVLLCTKQGTPN